MQICPVIFEPIYRPKIWGGRKLASLCGKHLPPDELIGESWECADLGATQSVVARGPAKGRTMHELVTEWGAALMGGVKLLDGRFPLLIKFLDAAQDLSIQVHPDAERARQLGGGVRAKHESWYILDAAVGAVIYRGLRSGVTLESLSAAVSARPETIIDYLNRIPVKAGEVYYLPGGVLHALGAGVVVAEIQTPSDVTYRLYDWGRVRPGADAGLHVQEGLTCIRTGIDFAPFEKRSHVTSVFNTVTRLITCPSFIIEKVRFVEGFELEIPYAEPVCWIVLAGHGEIVYGKNGRETFAAGEVVLLPAGLEHPRVKALADCQWLEVTIPVASDLADYPRPDAASLREPEGSVNKPIQLNVDIDRSRQE
jgi:mannose-6-phosphate isomerase